MPPPAPTAANCLWSPTSRSFAPAGDGDLPESLRLDNGRSAYEAPGARVIGALIPRPPTRR